jgi:Transmembrane secretion effector
VTELRPLRRNRDFVLLETGRLLSSLGSSSSSIAYPLLVLSLTHSPAKAGIVSFARTIPQPLFGLLAGVAADRFDRKRQMIAADVVRATTIGTLAGLVLADVAPWWIIPIVGAVEGTASTLFTSASVGALKSIVPREQLPAAVGVQRGRMATTLLAGPPIGGALFQIGRAVPFVVDAFSYGFSFLSLAAMRTPFQEERERDRAPLRRQLADGFTYLWSRPFLRTTALLYGLGNPLMPGILLVLVVVGRRQGLTGGEIGVLTAALGAAALLGSLVSPVVRRALPVRTIMLLEFMTWLGAWAFVAVPNVYMLLAVIVPFGIAAPITDSVVLGYAVAMTPDRLQGRVESVRSTIALVLYPLGSLAAGFLLEATTARVTIAVFATFALSLLVWGVLSPVLREAPSLSELSEAAVP